MIHLFFLFVIFMVSPLAAVQIKLEGDLEKVAYVNMHKIFEEYPETEVARAELSKVITTKREEITHKKEEIAQLKGEIESIKTRLALFSSTTSIPTIAVSSPTYQVEASTQSQKVVLEALQKQKESKLGQAQTLLPAFLTLSEGEIRNMEEGKTMALLANIYKAVETLSKEGGYSIILDKENILYGEEIVDLTPKVLKILRKSK